MYCESFTAQVPADPPYSVTYYLVEENGLYGIECFENGRAKDSAFVHSAFPMMTADVKDAEKVLEMLAKGAVCPLNVADVVEDYYSL